jgi:hypothetical protein
MIVGAADIGVLRRIRQAIERDRGGARPDVARELSIAVTAIEDAEMRLTRALVRQGRHKADAENAIEKIADQLVDPAVAEVEETTEQEVK